jgi:hypothetical protein
MKPDSDTELYLSWFHPCMALQPLPALASPIRHLPSSLFAALIHHPLIASSCRPSMYQRTIHSPYIQVVVYLSIPSKTSLRFSEYRVLFSRGGNLAPTPKPQPGGPGCHLLTGPSTFVSVRLGRPVPVAALPPV